MRHPFSSVGILLVRKLREVCARLEIFVNWHSINWGNFLVNVMIVLDVLATAAYAAQGDWKKSFYWLSCTSVMLAVRIM